MASNGGIHRRPTFLADIIHSSGRKRRLGTTPQGEGVQICPLPLPSRCIIVPRMQKLRGLPWWEPRAIKGSIHLSKPVLGQNIALQAVPVDRASIFARRGCSSLPPPPHPLPPWCSTADAEIKPPPSPVKAPHLVPGGIRNVVRFI